MPLPQNAFCSLFTWISGQAHVHFQIILLSHLSRDPHFHNTRDQFCLYAYNTYVRLHEAVFSRKTPETSFLYLSQAFSAKLLHLGLPNFQKSAVGQSRRHSRDLSWPSLASRKCRCDRDSRNVSTLQKVFMGTRLIMSQRIQLSHKSLLPRSIIFCDRKSATALRWQTPADVTSFGSI